VPVILTENIISRNLFCQQICIISNITYKTWRKIKNEIGIVWLWKHLKILAMLIGIIILV